MPKIRGKGVEDARSTLPTILKQAEKGQSTLITKYGRPIAAVVPLSVYEVGKGHAHAASGAASPRAAKSRGGAAKRGKSRRK